MTFYQRAAVILRIAWPLIIANSFWNLQLTIDRIFLGMYSTEALGAAMAVMGVFWVPMALLQQTSSYITTFVAQYFGAGEEEKIGACFWQSLYVSFFGGLLFLLLQLGSQDFFQWVGHSPSMQNLEILYFDSLSYTALPTALVAAISGFFTGLGQTRTVIGINLVGLILNAVLDYLLIFGNLGFPQMGVAGAGYSTAAATYGAALYGIFLLSKRSYETKYKLFSQWRPNSEYMLRFLRYGIPSGFQWALEGLAFTVFLIMIGRFPQGDVALAASSIAMTVMMLSVLPSMGVAQGVLSLVGQRLGDKRPDEAAMITWDGVKICSVYMSVVALSFWFVPEFYLSWFKNDENLSLWSEVQALAIPLLGLVALFTVFDSIYLNLSFALKGAGDTYFVSLIAFLVPWPLMVLPTFFLQTYEKAALYAWSFVVIYSITTTCILIWRFQKGKWKTMSVIH